MLRIRFLAALRMACAIVFIGSWLPNVAGADETTFNPHVAQSNVNELVHRAESLNDVEAQATLGWMYRYGRDGVAQNDELAVKWLRQAAEQGHAEAQRNLGKMYENGRGVPQDDAQAAAWYLQAAEQNNSTAQVNLGWLYTHGRGVPLDDKEAVRWFRKAAAQGDQLAAQHLANLNQIDVFTGRGATYTLCAGIVGVVLLIALRFSGVLA